MSASVDPQSDAETVTLWLTCSAKVLDSSGEDWDEWVSEWVAVMARLARIEVFAGDEIAIVHVMNRAVRRPVTNRDGVKDNAATWSGHSHPR